MTGHEIKAIRAVKRLRRKAMLSELAALGLSQVEACRLTGLLATQVSLCAREYGIIFQRKKRGESRLSRVVREGYAANKSPRQIAAETGFSDASIKVYACKMGLTDTTSKGRGHDPAKHLRGFSIPTERRQEYRDLRRIGLTMKEAGIEMHIIGRDFVAPREKAR